MKFKLNNKEIELTDEEVAEIVKQNSKPAEEKKVGLKIKNRFTGNIIFQSTKTTWKEAVEEANLYEADLREAYLSRADLSRANLYEADLREAYLSRANLCRADLSRADLRGADLCGANLSRVNLSRANLCRADLCGANLCGADLREAEMQNVKLYGKGGTTKIKKSQLDDFLKAIGVIMED